MKGLVVVDLSPVKTWNLSWQSLKQLPVIICTQIEDCYHLTIHDILKGIIEYTRYSSEYNHSHKENMLDLMYIVCNEMCKVNRS